MVITAKLIKSKSNPAGVDLSRIPYLADYFVADGKAYLLCSVSGVRRGSFYEPDGAPARYPIYTKGGKGKLDFHTDTPAAVSAATREKINAIQLSADEW